MIKKETSNNVLDYHYNAYDRLTKVKKDGTEIASYKYDPRGKRVKVTEEGNTTEYLWQGNSLLASYVNGSREELYATGRGMDEVLGVYSDETSYLHSNHLGSIKGITDVDGSVKGTKSYTPYGVTRETTGSFDTDLGFIGRRQSDVTGLTYIRARYYDASAGRFTKIDPIQDGLNWYGYAGGNPVNYYDPTGLFWKKTKDWWNRVPENPKKENGLVHDFLNLFNSTLGLNTTSATSSAISNFEKASRHTLKDGMVKTHALKGTQTKPFGSLGKVGSTLATLNWGNGVYNTWNEANSNTNGDRVIKTGIITGGAAVSYYGGHQAGMFGAGLLSETGPIGMATGYVGGSLAVTKAVSDIQNKLYKELDIE